MNNHKWVFKKNGGTGTADNIAGKLFMNDYAPLVRESIQNSLDVAVQDPVIVTFKFNKIYLPKDSPFFELEKWVEGGMEKFPNQEKRTFKNLRNIKETLSEIKKKGFISYLEVSDENTEGMDYSTDKHQQSETKLYSFIKSIGNSSKNSNTSAGSHGVGKVVFQKLSKINTIFVSSKSIVDGQEYFEGLSELCTSLVDDVEYEYRGYYCLNDDQEPTSNHSDIPEPFRRNTNGTSVFVMGVTDDIDEQITHLHEIEKAVVDNFWLSILHGKLIVQIDDSRIEKESIIDLAEQVYNKRELYPTNGSNDTQKYLEAVYFAECDNKHIYKHDSSIPELGLIHLYILKDKNGENRIQCMRETRMLIKTDKYPNYGFWGVFVCDGTEGNKNLRNAENAEHNQWNPKECEDEKDRQQSAKAIRAINKFINDKLREIFGGDKAGTSDISGAEDYLYMNVSEDELENPEMEVIMGKNKRETEDKEGYVQTTIFETPKTDTLPKERHGHVIIEKNDNASPNEDGDLMGGNSRHPHNPGPGPTPPPYPDNTEHTFKHDDHGEQGRFIRPIQVDYRPFFQKEQDEIYHYISITPTESCSEATVELIVKGDEDKDNDVIYIETSSLGTPSGNKITGLSFQKDQRLLVKIRFEDNLPHSLKLKAYEYKK